MNVLRWVLVLRLMAPAACSKNEPVSKADPISEAKLDPLYGRYYGDDTMSVLVDAATSVKVPVHIKQWVQQHSHLPYAEARSRAMEQFDIDGEVFIFLYDRALRRQ